MMKSNSEVAVYSLCMLHIAIEGLIMGWLPCCGKTEQPQRTQAPSDAANMQKDECSHSVVSVSVLWSAVIDNLLKSTGDAPYHLSMYPNQLFKYCGHS